MRTRTPLSIALRAFEAAARNLSFTLAGEELHLTQGAISRQIRLLEEFLGQPLFERLTRRVELTSTGRDYYLDVQQALRELDRATHRAMRSSGRSVLAISVLPTFGTSWLMPRLANFVEQHPDLDVRLATSIDVVDFQRSETDVAIRVGRVPGDTYPENSPRVDSEIVANWRGVMTDYLAPDILLPIHSPSLLETGTPITSATDLLEYPLIHTVSRRFAWDHWLQAFGLNVPQGDRLMLSHYFMGIRAAEEGRGIALIPSILVPSESLGRSLAAPLRTTLQSAGGYYLAYQESRAEEPSILAFRQWVLHETRSWRAFDERG
jgi:LysR family glycine cleavage system transcriptional activator